LISRYSSQSKTKEASSLREDAFQLHEARKAYLKASMDYSVLAPQVRHALDKLLVKIFSDRWRDMKNSRDALAASFGKWSGDIDRIRGWSKEMENNERVFKRELDMARTQIENAAESQVRPPRELDDYAVSTVPYIGSSAPITKQSEEKADKQGWLFQRTISGRPTRTVWIRRWFYVKHGIFGYLTNNIRNGAVEESEKIGVLLCGVRPAFNEERRFCFEVKTKDMTIVLQAETQSDLTEWISTFEIAKRKALENPASTEAIAAGSKSIDAAFAITPPVAPEFAVKNGEQEDNPPERSNTLGVEPSVVRSSTDVSSRRAVPGDRDGESSRDHAARIISKLKSNQGPPSSSQSGAGGIAGLIAASHHGLALGVGGSPPQLVPSNPLNISTDFKAILGNYLPLSSLAPSTLANPPAPTNLSKTAVVVSGERKLGLGATANDGGMPSGLMANIWGSANWGFANRFERGDAKRPIERRRSVSQPPSPIIGMAPIEGGQSDTPELSPLTHRKTTSMVADTSRQPVRGAVTLDDYPNYYPLTLKAQDAQFRMLFPDVSREDKLVLVFRAAWTATDQYEFPGRVYITMNDIYFYSNHFGLVLVSSISLDSIHEITAAPGKDCDFLFVHLKPGVSTDGTTRVTIKTFLEPLKMLERRLAYLLRNADAEEPESLEGVIKALIKLEIGGADESPSMESWEDVSPNTPTDGMARREYDSRVGLRIDGTLYPTLSHSVSRNATKFRLPVQPVVYVPQGMTSPTIQKEFDVTAKALFHVLAGDKSAVFQMLNCENGAERKLSFLPVLTCLESLPLLGLIQSPWVQPEQGHHRREFRYQVANGGKRFDVADHQLIDVLNDHLCYVITDRRTPWSLPSPHKFSLMTKIVITHAAKSRCRLSIYTRVDWRKDPLFGKGKIALAPQLNY
jgi:VAD1 Analog of StAR-related lipid transfer domain/PH domain